MGEHAVITASCLLNPTNNFFRGPINQSPVSHKTKLLSPIHHVPEYRSIMLPNGVANCPSIFINSLKDADQNWPLQEVIPCI